MRWPLFSLLQRLLGSNRSARRRSRARPPHGFAPRLEALEDRLLLSLGSPFNVAVGNQQNESASASWAGGSVVVWSEPRPGGTDRDVKAQILDTAGKPMFPVVTVAGTNANEHKPAVAVDDQGNFVVVWTKDISTSDSDVQVRRFDKTGTPTAQLGTASSVAGSTALKEYDASVAMAADGEFVVSYTQEVATGTGSTQQNVAAADYFFSSSGTYSSTPMTFTVAGTTDNESESSVARTGNTFAIAYESGTNLGFAPSDNPGVQPILGNVYLRPYVQGTGGMVTSSTSAAVPVSSSKLSSAPSIALDSFNEAVVAWQETLTAGSKLTVRATKFNSAWAPVAVTLSDGTSTTTLNVQGPSGVDYVFPSVVLNSANGNFAVAYQSGIYGSNVHVQVTEVTFLANSSTPSLTTVATLSTTDLGANLSLPALSIHPASGDYLLTYTNQSSTPTLNGIVGVIDTALTPSRLTPAVFGLSPQTGQVVALIPTSPTAGGASIWATFDPTVTWVDFLSGDFNGDGKPDIAAFNAQTGQIFVGLSSGASFTVSQWGQRAQGQWVDTVVGDFNGDGKDDIAMRDPATGNVLVALSTGSSFVLTSGGTWLTSAQANGADWQDVRVGHFRGFSNTDANGVRHPVDDIEAGIILTGPVNIGAVTGASNTAPLTITTDTKATGVLVNGSTVVIVGVGGNTAANGTFTIANLTSTSFTLVDSTGNDVIGNGTYTGGGTIYTTETFRDIFIAESSGSSFAQPGKVFVQEYWQSWSQAPTWVDVTEGDFTGDGKAALTARVLQNGTVWVSYDYTHHLDRFFGGPNSGGQDLWQFWDPNVTWLNVSAGNFDTGAAADIGGKTDLLARRSDTNGVYVSLDFVPHPAAPFDFSGQTTQQLWGTLPLQLPWVDFQVADFSGDGKADFVARLQTSGAWYLFHSTGSQQLGFTQAFYSLWNPQGNWGNVSLLGVN